MTNFEKLKSIFPQVFGIKMSKYGDVIHGCKYIECPQKEYREECSKCPYKTFWEDEYDNSEEEDLVERLYLLRTINGLSREEFKTLTDAIIFIEKRIDDECERTVCEQAHTE